MLAIVFTSSTTRNTDVLQKIMNRILPLVTFEVMLIPEVLDAVALVVVAPLADVLAVVGDGDIEVMLFVPNESADNNDQCIHMIHY